MNLRIVFMELGMNPFHIHLNLELMVRLFIYLIKSRGIKRR
jgi:hypothetical protein